eukprot:jgi/Chrpa1/5339/Chrysochromulina_OHIO_Genome00003730-RA
MDHPCLQQVLAEPGHLLHGQPGSVRLGLQLVPAKGHQSVEASKRLGQVALSRIESALLLALERELRDEVHSQRIFEHEADRLDGAASGAQLEAAAERVLELTPLGHVALVIGGQVRNLGAHELEGGHEGTRGVEHLAQQGRLLHMVLQLGGLMGLERFTLEPLRFLLIQQLGLVRQLELRAHQAHLLDLVLERCDSRLCERFGLAHRQHLGLGRLLASSDLDDLGVELIHLAEGAQLDRIECLARLSRVRTCGRELVDHPNGLLLRASRLEQRALGRLLRFGRRQPLALKLELKLLDPRTLSAHLGAHLLELQLQLPLSLGHLDRLLLHLLHLLLHLRRLALRGECSLFDRLALLFGLEDALEERAELALLLRLRLYLDHLHFETLVALDAQLVGELLDLPCLRIELERRDTHLLLERALVLAQHVREHLRLLHLQLKPLDRLEQWRQLGARLLRRHLKPRRLRLDVGQLGELRLERHLGLDLLDQAALDALARLHLDLQLLLEHLQRRLGQRALLEPRRRERVRRVGTGALLITLAHVRGDLPSHLWGRETAPW